MEIVFASPSRGPIPAPAIIRDAPFVFAGGGVRPEARRRGAGSLLLREIRSLMHNLDKSMLTLAAHGVCRCILDQSWEGRTGENAQSRSKPPDQENPLGRGTLSARNR
jgi:hypothetical protein